MLGTWKWCHMLIFLRSEREDLLQYKAKNETSTLPNLLKLHADNPDTISLKKEEKKLNVDPYAV